jgi:hypothetical membrane protein
MLFTPILAHGAPLITLYGCVLITAVLLVPGFVIVLTSKTNRHWNIGACLCLLGGVLLILFGVFFWKVTRFLGFE